MKTFIAFLRGINVSGQKKIKMIELKTSLEKEGFKNVQTYIQSGNIILNSEEDIFSIKEGIRKVILKDFGFEVPVLVTTKEVLGVILEKYPFEDADDKNQYYTLLFDKPDANLIDGFHTLKFNTEDFLIAEDCVYLNCKVGAGKAKLNNNLIEKKLKVTATTRNLRTMQKMLLLAS